MSTISIIMPVKNALPYLRECIESVLIQTYTDWELLAVDDHSSDGSQSLMRDFASRDNRVKVFINKGRGIIPALQCGYSHSKGQFISRMDADDLMPSTKLELLSNEWNQKGLGSIITGKVKYFADYPLGEGYKKYEEWMNHLTSDDKNFTEIYRECPIASPNWLIHRKDFENAGAFNSSLYPEDYDLVFRWRNSGLQVSGLPVITHKWRDYKNRTSRTDDNYSDNRFSALKVHHYLLQDYDDSKSLFLWGAGNKGKAVAKELNSRKVPFRWISNNEKKIGHEIYDVIIESPSELQTEINKQCIIAVSQKGAQEEIVSKLEKYNCELYDFFC